MSARLQRWGQQALVLIVLTFIAAASPSDGQAQQITLSAGDGTLTSVAPNTSFGLPIQVDMSQAGAENIAALTGSIIWDPARITFQSVSAGPFGSLITNETQVGSGQLTFSLFSPTGTTNTFDALTINFQAGAAGVVVLTPQVQAAGNDVGADITSLMRVTPLELCIGTGGGLWGDVTGDGQVNIIDAQQIARFSVGLPVGNPTLMAALGDVTADGQVNIIDAQQIARFSVGLPAAARIGTVSPGSCTAPVNQAVLDLTPTSLTFTASAGANPIPDNQRFQIQNNGSVFMQYTISDNAPWLTTSRTSGPLSPGDRIFIDAIVNSSNLAVGQYNAVITVSDPAAAGSPKTVDVSLNVVAPCNTLDGTVGVGGSVAGALDNQDCQLGWSTYTDRWELTLTQETAVQIDLTGSTLGDPYLFLTTTAATDPTDPGQAAEVLAENDDANGTLNSRIDITLQPGSYIIWTTSYPGIGFTAGDYLLTITGSLIASARFAYAWANQPTSPTYSPHVAYALNSSGGSIEIQRTATGNYDVTFEGLAASGTTEAIETVLVSAYDATAICGVAFWNDTGGDLRVRVYCNSPAGVPQDSRFTVLVVGATSIPGPTGFLWASSTASSYAPDSQWAWNSSNAPMLVSLGSVGAGPARAIDIGTADDPSRGVAHLATPYGTGDHYCGLHQIDFGTSMQTVACRDASGALDADRRFTYMMTQGGRPNMRAGFGFAEFANQPTQTPRPNLQFNTGGGSVTITRSAVGSYRFDFPGLQKTGTDTETVILNTLGTGVACSIDGWNNSGSGSLIVDVSCFDRAGAPQDTQVSAYVVQ